MPLSKSNSSAIDVTFGGIFPKIPSSCWGFEGVGASYGWLVFLLINTCLKSLIVDLYFSKDKTNLDISEISLVTPDIIFFKSSLSFYSLLLYNFLLSLKLLNSGKSPCYYFFYSSCY